MSYDNLLLSEGFDDSYGLMTSAELADALRVDIKTVQRWGRAAAAAVLNGGTPRLPVMRLPGGDYRFSRKWACDQVGERG